MGIEIGSGITIGPGINISYIPTGPSLGTDVPWTSGTYFDSWTSQSGVTTTDLPTTNTAGASSSYNTNNLVWQLFYAWQAITIPIDTTFFGINTTVSNTNTIQLRFSQSTLNGVQGSFDTDVQIGSTSGAYTAGGLKTGPVTTSKSVPANRYFLLGITTGPFYRSFKNLAANRTASVGGSPVITAVNKLWWPGWPGGPTTGVPTQLGGASTFTEVSGVIPVTSFKFTVT